MAFNFKPKSDTEFSVNGHVVRKDSNSNWIVNPPIESNQLLKAVNDYIISIEN